ncbi:MAG TPA: zinc-dependent metalloprotease family protein, partial [Steroidobacteraceae bacterium]|nr:zinc-dependent metalloprotease family protein [Steroidobacteraceae bacterium]
GIESRILSAIAAANQAYANSGLALQLNLVHMAETSYVESGDMGAALSALRIKGDGVMDDAHTLRDQYGADLVALVNEDTNYCGIGYVMTSVSSGFAAYAFSVTASGCISNQTFAHEVGHNQGNMHNREDSTNAGAYPYSYGFRRCLTDGTGFRTVMSYSCNGAPRVNYFSNPTAYYNGYATGIAYESDPANSAEAARSMANTASTIAAFRQGSVAEPPVAPSGLTATALSASSVGLTWNDNSSTESGHTVERSANGVDFAQIASLGSNTTSYVDNALAARSTYWYRVRAFNAAGASVASLPVEVTTLDEAPASPGPVSAAPSGSTVAVSWTDASSNETGFEIGRESYNSKNRRWNGLTVIATTAANVSAFTDSPGSGTYR